MKKNLFFGVAISTIVASTVLFFACQKSEVYEDVIMYQQSILKAVDQLAFRSMNKHYNHLSERELRSLLGNNVIEIINIMKEMNLSENLRNFLSRYEKRIGSSLENSENKISQAVRSRCPQRFYGIRTYIANSGSLSCNYA